MTGVQTCALPILERLGNMLGQRREGLRTGERADIDRLGELGRQLKLRARWEPTGGAATPEADVLKKALGTTMGGVAELTGLRSRPARAAQRFYSQVPKPFVAGVEQAGVVPALGTMTRPLKGEE